MLRSQSYPNLSSSSPSPRRRRAASADQLNLDVIYNAGLGAFPIHVGNPYENSQHTICGLVAFPAMCFSFGYLVHRYLLHYLPSYYAGFSGLSLILASAFLYKRYSKLDDDGASNPLRERQAYLVKDNAMFTLILGLALLVLSIPAFLDEALQNTFHPYTELYLMFVTVVLFISQYRNHKSYENDEPSYNGNVREVQRLPSKSSPGNIFLSVILSLALLGIGAYVAYSTFQKTEVSELWQPMGWVMLCISLASYQLRKSVQSLSSTGSEQDVTIPAQLPGNSLTFS